MTDAPSARLLLPGGALSGCVFAGIERDTRRLVLSDAERFNYYPATPLAMISWIFEGDLHMVEERGPAEEPKLGPALPRLILSGPQRLPVASWSPGPVHALSVAFYPEALGQLLGVAMEEYRDRIVPLDVVAAAPVLDACASLLDESDEGDPLGQLEQRIAPLWRGSRTRSAGPFMGAWIRSLLARAAFSTSGRGVRQIQRRIKEWTGQSYRDLQLFARVEAMVVCSAQHRQGNALDLASLALGAGFADQSHMGREVRRVTGLSPARLDQLMATDEGFWFYRLIEGHVTRSDLALQPRGRTEAV